MIESLPVAAAQALPHAAGRAVLDDAHFELFRTYFYQRTGIRFASSKRYFVDKRVEACVRESGEPNFLAWFAAVRTGTRPELVEQMINRFTVNETYFLREESQFDDLVGTLLPEITARRGSGEGPIRILSLPCSTGEEPYSIALRLLSDWPMLEHTDVEIHAADIDSAVLARARRGVYGARSLQRMPSTLVEQYFTRVGSDEWQIGDDVRSVIEFHQINVQDERDMSSLVDFDVVFCRNMLIYFDEVSCRRAAEHLYGALRPGGHLFLGHSESMSRISPIFTARRLPAGLVYRRPGARP